jgi:hypothetical protein
MFVILRSRRCDVLVQFAHELLLLLLGLGCLLFYLFLDFSFLALEINTSYVRLDQKFRTCHLKKRREHDCAWSKLLAVSTNSRGKKETEESKTCHLFQLLPLFGSPKNF